MCRSCVVRGKTLDLSSDCGSGEGRRPMLPHWGLPPTVFVNFRLMMTMTCADD